MRGYKSMIEGQKNRQQTTNSRLQRQFVKLEAGKKTDGRLCEILNIDRGIHEKLSGYVQFWRQAVTINCDHELLFFRSQQ